MFVVVSVFMYVVGNLNDISAIDGRSDVVKCCFHPSMSLFGKQVSTYMCRVYYFI